MEKYKVSEDTAALIGCIEKCNDLHDYIYDALVKHYDEKAVEREIGSPVFDKLQEVREELFKVLNAVIAENLCTTSTEKEI